MAGRHPCDKAARPYPASSSGSRYEPALPLHRDGTALLSGTEGSTRREPHDSEDTTGLGCRPRPASSPQGLRLWRRMARWGELAGQLGVNWPSFGVNWRLEPTSKFL